MMSKKNVQRTGQQVELARFVLVEHGRLEDVPVLREDLQKERSLPASMDGSTVLRTVQPCIYYN